MALLERVTTLIRANLNDLIDKAEEPEKMIRQIILDMENQLMQVKTQVAISIADQHMLERKRKESQDSEQQWLKRAEMAIGKEDEGLARAAAERAMSFRSIGENFAGQVEDQKTQVENFKTALLNLQQKLEEAKSKSDLLVAKRRRARALTKAADAGRAVGDHSNSVAFDRMARKTQHAESAAQASAELTGASIEDQFAAIESEKAIDRLLAELKSRRRAG
jgi:phage shock protein A